MGSGSRKTEDNISLSVDIGGGLGGWWVPRKVPLGPEFGIRVAVDGLRQEERIPGRGCTCDLIEVEMERGWVCSRMGRKSEGWASHTIILRSLAKQHISVSEIKVYFKIDVIFNLLNVFSF